MKRKKRARSFLNTFLLLAALWVLGVGAVTVYFQAKGNPLDPSVVATLISPGVGEFGIGALIKWIKDKYDAEKEREKAEAMEAENEALRAELETAQKKLAAAQAESKKLKTERDAARKEADGLNRQRQATIEEISRQVLAAQAAAAE